MTLRTLFTGLTLSVFVAGQAAAASYSHVSVGSVWEYDVFGQIGNPRVVVRDKAAGKVLIQIAEGNRTGEMRWVPASSLLTSDQSEKQEAENVGAAVGLGVVGTVMVICLFKPAACEKK